MEPGSTVTAYIRPEDVKVLYPDRPLSDAVRHNLVTGRISDSYLRPGARHLKVLLPNEHEIEVAHPPYTYAPLTLEVGEEVQLALRRRRSYSLCSAHAQTHQRLPHPRNRLQS